MDIRMRMEIRNRLRLIYMLHKRSSLTLGLTVRSVVRKTHLRFCNHHQAFKIMGKREVRGLIYKKFQLMKVFKMAIRFGTVNKILQVLWEVQMVVLTANHLLEIKNIYISAQSDFEIQWQDLFVGEEVGQGGSSF